MSLGYVFVRSGVAVDSNGECRKKSNRERVTKVLVRIRPAMRKPCLTACTVLNRG
jgi:hypothetical protein